jgi:hypothetical protein
MKEYVSPDCRVRQLDLEASFLTGGSAGGFPVDPSDPFNSRSNWTMEDDYE